MDPVELRGNQEVSRIADRAVTALLSKARIPPLAPLEAGQRISTAELRPMMRHLVAALYARVRGAYPGVLGRTLQEGVEGSVLQAVASGAFDFLLAKARSKNPALPDDHRARDKGPEDPNAVMPLEMVFRLFQEKTPPKRISYAPPPGPRNKT
jgi:hypothetical protein